MNLIKVIAVFILSVISVAVFAHGPKHHKCHKSNHPVFGEHPSSYHGKCKKKKRKKCKRHCEERVVYRDTPTRAPQTEFEISYRGAKGDIYIGMRK